MTGTHVTTKVRNGIREDRSICSSKDGERTNRCALETPDLNKKCAMRQCAADKRLLLRKAVCRRNKLTNIKSARIGSTESRSMLAHTRETEREPSAIRRRNSHVAVGGDILTAFNSSRSRCACSGFPYFQHARITTVDANALSMGPPIFVSWSVTNLLSQCPASEHAVKTLI